jgi:protein O-GlcNAc transferase
MAKMLNWIKKKIGEVTTNSESGLAQTVARQEPQPKSVKEQGDEHVKAGRYADAERCYRLVEDSDGAYPTALVNLGFVLREQGRTSEAREVLDRAVSIATDDADAYYLLASILESTGPSDAEISYLQKAIELRPDFDFARRQLIIAYFKSSRHSEATALCEESLAMSPDSAELHFYRSNLYVHTNEKEQAIAGCKRALALNPGLLAAQQSLSRLLFDTEQFEEAETSYRREIKLTPDHFGAYHQLGMVLHRTERYAEAIEQFKQAISLKPDSAASHWNLGNSYSYFSDAAEENLILAHESFEKAAAIAPEISEFAYSLGLSYWRRAEFDRALAGFNRAIDLDSGNVQARWARVMLWAPVFSGSNDGSLERSGLGAELSRFEDWWIENKCDGPRFVGELQPFFLAYQEEDNLALLTQHGKICAMSMQRWLDGEKSPAFVRPAASRIRLGIVSADIRLHSVWMALIKGWLQSFDTDRFELVIFSLADRVDQETAWARSKSDVLIGGPKTLSQWVAAIREQNCEILLYPAVGMHPLALKLACLRLAPVQMNSWGHPDTSGLPTLDYYVSADCFEPANAQAYYSEKLICLPHLGSRIQPMALQSVDLDFAALNIDLGRPILVCPGSPFKYQPTHDHVLVEIARRLPHAQFIFFRPVESAIVNVLQGRITKEFEKAGLDVMDHVRFIRWLNMNEFHILMKHGTVMLDTIGFSGYNTALQGVECGLPVVTREGQFLRGRLASGILRRMDLQELIVENAEDYVNLVVRLVTDKDYRTHIRKELEQRRSVLFDDESAMGPFQDFLESAARPDGRTSAPKIR